MHLFGYVFGISVKNGQISKPPLVVIMAVGYNDPLDILETLTADLLEKRCPSVKKID